MKFIFNLLLLICISQNCAAEAIIAIDIGHSKLHSGASSARGEPEFNFNLDLARVVHDDFNSHKLPSFLLGEDGEMIELLQRSASAEKLGAKFFLSIHHDSAQAKYLKDWTWQGVRRRYTDQFSGFSLFISRKNQQPEKSLLCAQTIGKALEQNGFRPSTHHAEPIRGENREWADKAAGVYYYDDLIVLKTAKMPAVLLEAGVIVNRDEELKIQKLDTRKLIAASIRQGLLSCKGLN